MGFLTHYLYSLSVLFILKQINLLFGELAVNQLILGALIVSAERWAVFTHKSSLTPSKINTDFDDLHYDNDMTIILTEKT